MFFAWGQAIDDPLTSAFASVKKAYPSPVRLFGQEQFGDSIPIEVSCGYSHTLLRTEDGSVFSYGLNTQIGRRGDGSKLIRIGGILLNESIINISAGANHSCAVSDTGILYEWGNLFRSETRPSASDGNHALVGMGLASRNEYLRRIIERSEAAYLANRNIDEIVTEGEGNITIQNLTDSSTMHQQHKDGDTLDASEILKVQVRRINIPTPRRAQFPEKVIVRHVSCGFAHTIATDMYGKCWASGYNDRGQLGTGNRKPISSYARIIIPEDVTIIKTSCGQTHTLGIDTNGTLWSWGSGVLGQLGHGGSGDHLIPTLVVDLVNHTIIDIAAGSNHTLALSNQGYIYGCGHSEYGQLVGCEGGAEDGDMVTSSRHFYRPRKFIALENVMVKNIYAGGNFSLAILQDGSIVSWGWNAMWSLGRGEGERYLPSFGLVLGDMRGTLAVSAAAGLQHAVAVTATIGNPHAMALFSALTSLLANKSIALFTQRTATSIPIGRVSGPAGLSTTEAIELSGGNSRHIPNLVRAGAGAAAKRLRARRTEDEHVEEEEDIHEIQNENVLFDSNTQTENIALVQDPEEEPFVDTDIPFPDVFFVPLEMDSVIEKNIRPIPSLNNISTPTLSPTSPLSSFSSSSSSFSAVRASLEKQLLKLGVTAKATTKNTSNTISKAIGDELTPVATHAVIISARCASIAKAMRIVYKNNTTVSIADYPGTSIRFHNESSTLANYPHWEVSFPNSSSSILAALAAFLYCDRLLPLPKHRLPSLITIAKYLQIPSLEKQCENALKARESLNDSKINDSNGEDAVRLLPQVSKFNLENSIKEKSKFLSSWSQDMSSLCQWNQNLQAQTDIENKKNFYSDIDVIVLGEKKEICAIYSCHKVILARVPYFRAFMRRTTVASGFKPSTSISLDDVDPNDVYTILQFVYTGILNPTTERLLPLLALASRLCMTRLMSRLQNILATVAGDQDVPTLLEAADTLRLPRLMRLAKALSSTYN